MDYRVYRTRDDAEREIADMLGWAARPVRLCWPDHPWAHEWEGVQCVWGICCNDDLYLRDDGYVR